MKEKVLTEKRTVAMNSGISWRVCGVKDLTNCVTFISAFSAGSFAVLQRNNLMPVLDSTVILGFVSRRVS